MKEKERKKPTGREGDEKHIEREGEKKQPAEKEGEKKQPTEEGGMTKQHTEKER